jgi:phosphate transport system substrate-binding protein
MKRSINVMFVIAAVSSLALTACGTATQTPVSTTAPGSTISAPTPLPAGAVTINGAGATFPQPLYMQWTYAYQFVDPSVIINYQGMGSGAGKTAIINNTVDFAGSDSLLTDQNYTDGKDLQMYPIVAGAVVPIYNIKFNTLAAGAGTPTPAPVTPATLVLDRQALVGIFNGTIAKWNDPAIVSLNADLKDLLPDAAITAVHRSDGSGTTEIFTKALTSFSPEWTAGGASSIQWPTDSKGAIGAKGNPGVAGTVLNTPNSIGYVELNFALANNIAFIQMINKAGNKVAANAASLASAMTDFATSFTDKLTNTIVDAPGAESWPIAGYTYLILHTTSMTDCVKTQKLLEYIRWTLTDPIAAEGATKLGYSTLSPSVQTQVLVKLSEVTCSGTPVLK